MVRQTTRRSLLASLGAASAWGTAGCTGFGRTPAAPTTDDETSTASPTPSPTTDDPPPAGSAAETLDDFEDLSRWNAVRGALGPSEEQEAYRGSQSARVTLDSADELVWIRRDAGWDLSGKSLSVALDVREPAGTVIATLRLHAPDDANTVTVGELLRSVPGQGWFRMDAGARSVSGTPSLSRVERVDLLVRAVGGGPVDVRVDDLRAAESFDGGRVAITFDDGLDSQYEAFRLMREAGLPATVAAVPDRVGDDGYLSLAQMEEMRSAGWEFASQPTGTSLRSASAERTRRALADAREWFESRGFRRGARSLIYPAGEWDREMIEIARQSGYEAGYRYLSTYGSGSGPISDPWTVSRGEGANVDAVRTMLDLSALFGDLRIFAFRGVGRGSDSISVRDFERVVDVVERRDLTVVTLSEVRASMTATVDGSRQTR